MNDLLSDGSYEICFRSIGRNGGQKSERVGGYEIRGGNITESWGSLSDLLPTGPMTVMTLFRLNASFNNGYYFTMKVRD